MSIYTDESAVLNPYSAAAHINRGDWGEMSKEAELALMKAYNELAEAARVMQELRHEELTGEYDQFFNDFWNIPAAGTAVDDISAGIEALIANNGGLFEEGFSVDFRAMFEEIEKSDVLQDLEAAKALFTGENGNGSGSRNTGLENEGPDMLQNGNTGWQL